MTSQLTPTRLLGGAVIIGVIASAFTMASVVVLAARYRPVSPDVSNPLEGWLVIHRSAAAILGMACFAAFLVLVWPSSGPAPWRRAGAILASGLATVASALAILTRDMVLWDQIALAAVTVGENVWGYWFAAFGPDIRFVIVDGIEVSQAAYAITLVVHVAAPLVAVALLALTPVAARCSTAPR